MRFYDDIKYYYFSTNRSTDDEERSIIIRQGMEFFKEEMSAGFKPEKSVFSNVVKYSAIAAFIGAVALIFYFSKTSNVAGILYTFAGVFIMIGVLAAIPSRTPQKDLPRRAKMHPLVGSALCISIGLGVLIPAIIAPSYGYTKAFVAGGASWFVTGGLFFVFYTFLSIIRQARTAGNVITGKCIGYIKMVDSTNGDVVNHQRLYTIGTPVFEYYFNGETYRAFQEDDLRTGVLKPAVGETAELTIDPADPYNIYYRKNTAARTLTFALALMALAAGIAMFCFLPNVNDNNGFSVNTQGGQVRLAKAKFDDDLIESYIKTSDFTIGYYMVVSSKENGDSAVIELSNGNHRSIPGSDRDKYYEGAGVYVITPAGGGAGINFMADEWEYSGTREIQYG